MTTVVKRSLAAAALVVVAFPALAHEFRCEGSLGRVKTDGTGAPVLGEDGLPILAHLGVEVPIRHYPSTIGFRVRVQNTAPDTSVMTDVWSSLDGLPGFTWFGDGFSARRAFPAGARGEVVATVRIEDQAGCLALRGDTPACGYGFQSRFVISHDAGSTECRIPVRCGPDPQPGEEPYWARVPSGTGQDLTGVWGSAADDIWAVGAQGVILHWEGQAWSPVESGTTEDLTAVSGTSADDVWVTGEHVVLHWDGTAWSTRMSYAGTLRGVWGSGPDDVWVSSESPLFHWNGAGWETIEVPGVLDGFQALWGSSPDDVWAGGVGVLAHWTGPAGWELVWLPIPYPTHALWGWAPGSLFAGAPALIYRLVDGEVVSSKHFMSAIHQGLWGSSAEDVWAVGTSPDLTWPMVYRWVEGAWHGADTTAVNGLLAVWGASADDVWAVGQRGEIVRYSRHGSRGPSPASRGSLTGATR